MFWIGLAITAVGGLLGVPLWRSWIQSRLRQGTDRVFDIIRSTLIIVGVVISAVSYLQSRHENETLRGLLLTTQGESAESRLELTTTPQQQAAVEQELRRLQEQQRPRALTPEQQQALLHRLQKGQKVMLTFWPLCTMPKATILLESWIRSSWLRDG